MRALSADDVLDIIEWGTGHSLTSTVLHLLERADTTHSIEQLAALPVGARDRLVLALRRNSLTGPLVARECCPQCDTELELALQPEDLALDDPPFSIDPQLLEADGMSIRYRLPNSNDLLALETFADEHSAAQTLAWRCIESVTRGDEDVAPDAIGREAFEQLNDAMALADPQADLSLELSCSNCGHRFERELDIAAFFIQELVNVSHHVLHDVYALARGYGFSESEILAMSAWRRRAYLEMLTT